MNDDTALVWKTTDDGMFEAQGRDEHSYTVMHLGITALIEFADQYDNEPETP